MLISIKNNGTLLRRIVIFVMAAMMLSFSSPANSPQSRFMQVTDRSVGNRRALRSLSKMDGFISRAFDPSDGPHYDNTTLQRAVDPVAPKYFTQTRNPYKNKNTHEQSVANTVIAVKHAISRHHMIQFNVDTGGGKRVELILRWIRAQQVDLI